MSVGDGSGESSILSIEQSQCSRDSFSTDNSWSADEADRHQVQAGEHQDRDQGQEDARSNVATVPAPLLPSNPSVTSSGSLVANTASATTDLHIFPTIPLESPFRPPSRYLLSIPKTPSSLRKLAYSAPVQPIQGEQRSNKRKADDLEDSVSLDHLLGPSSTADPCPLANGQEAQDGTLHGHSSPVSSCSPDRTSSGSATDHLAQAQAGRRRGRGRQGGVIRIQFLAARRPRLWPGGEETQDDSRVRAQEHSQATPAPPQGRAAPRAEDVGRAPAHEGRGDEARRDLQRLRVPAGEEEDSACSLMVMRLLVRSWSL